ncbi:MAG TPA: aldose 1-epimerase [Bryobacteraceae bacterium]|nr:aldose 1-epimerase [Bryobacteraceae bacterium]
MPPPGNYAAATAVVDGINVVRLSDAARATEVSIATPIGNMAYEFKVRGKNVLWFPFASPWELKVKPRFCGIPFLAPWANRIDGDSYWVNGSRYLLNPGLGNLGRDDHHRPIHGLLSFFPDWILVSLRADHCASATFRLECARHPALMAQFPFAHTITMTHRLADGALEIETTIENQCAEPIPVAIGYHPYFRLPDVPRDRWRVHLAARDQVVLDDLLIPTGERRAVEFADPHPLAAAPLDDVFTNLVRDPDERARFWVEGDRQRITVDYGPKYTVAVVYSPAGHDFICFEPMAAITDAFNLAHTGVYREMQSIPPGQVWKESFWISVAG